MSSRVRAARPITFIGATGAIVLLALAAAPAASAATIYACVSNKGGAARIVSARAKCHRGERKLSWNAAGPAGAPGAPGAAGAPGSPGANGAGVDYGSANFGPVDLAEGSTGNVVVSKTIPAGTYFVNAKTVIGAGEATKAVYVAVICELVDGTGTVSFVEPPKALDLGEWVQQLSYSGTEYAGAGTVAMQAQLTTTEPTTLAMVCAPLDGGKESDVLAIASQLSALQTTANK